ncbi:PBP1A family penicillin-binding protein [Clostridia bacterium]|nr:PBP1A family penicillin-binding protein [Clostridia bacterium]
MDKKKPIKKHSAVSKKTNNMKEDDVKIYTGNDGHSASESPKNRQVRKKPTNNKSRKNKKHKKSNRTWVKVLKVIFLVLVVVGLIIAGFITRYVLTLADDIPEWDQSDMTGDLTTTFYDADGNEIAERHGVENRFPVEFELVPDDLKNAFIANEDLSFYDHMGISLKGILRSVVVNIKEQRKAQGASTITQLLARNALIDSDTRYQKDWDRKIKEIILAFQIESRYEKDEIFELFLNTIPFGEGAYGVQAAAQTFFGKDVQDLDLAECALLAGLPQRPSGYNPFDYPDSALGRRSQILLNMEINGFITTAEKDMANNEPLDLAPEPTSYVEGPYLFFIDYAMEEAETILEDMELDSDIYRNGYKIYTTMNNLAQTNMEELFLDPENFPEDMNDKQVQAAMVIIEQETGEIQAMMGGREYISQRGFNRAASPEMNRQPGSSIKPVVVYGPALEYGGMSSGTVIDDIPVSIPTEQGPYEPTNYDGRYRGLITMREAVRNSVNIPAVKILDEIGTVTGYNFAKNLGIPFEENEQYNLSIALGGMSYGCNPLELARAYGAFANEGILVDSYSVARIETKDGSVIYEANPQKKVAMTEETAYIMSDMLQTVVNYGTGYNAKIPNWQTAGKTGTTQLPTSTPAERAMFAGLTGNKDAWFAGYTKKYTSVVWMGFDSTDKDHYLKKIYGGKYPALLFQKAMAPLHEDLAPINFERPSDVISVAIDQKSGLLPSALTPADYIIRELFTRENVPTETSDAWKEAIVCTESHMLGTYLCPSVETKVFLNRDTTYMPTVPIGNIQSALSRYGVSSVENLPANVIESLVKNIIPEDYSLMAPTEYCSIHYGAVDQNPALPGEDLVEPTQPSTPTVNPIYWEYFPTQYRPSNYSVPKEPSDSEEPFDPMQPPEEEIEEIVPDQENDEIIEGSDQNSGINIFKNVRIRGTIAGAKLEWDLDKDYQDDDWEFVVWKQADNDLDPYILATTSVRELQDSEVEAEHTYYYLIQATRDGDSTVYSSTTYKIIY